MGKASSAKRDRRLGKPFSGPRDRPGRDEAAFLVARSEDKERWLEAIAPDVWERLDAVRDVHRGEWPDYCLLSIESVGEALSDVLSHLAETDVLAAHQVHVEASCIYPWRWGRQIVRVDPDLADALAATPLEVDLPAEVLTRLPAWGLYVSQPRGRVRGAWMWLAWEEITRRANLCMLIDEKPNSTRPVLLPLGVGGLRAAIDDQLAEIRAQAKRDAVPDELAEHVFIKADEAFFADLAPLVATALYLCSTDPDIVTASSTKAPRPKPAGPVQQPRVWEMGWRLGAQLRQARSPRPDSVSDAPGQHRALTPHMRVAHWHHYWTGPLDGERVLVLRWLHPIMVAVPPGSKPPTTIRSVK